MTGIELLEEIKSGNIKNGTTIVVYARQELITSLVYDGNLKWKPGTFNTSMLWDEEFLFYPIVDKEIDWKIIRGISDTEIKSLADSELIELLILNQRDIIENQRYLKAKMEELNE